MITHHSQDSTEETIFLNAFQYIYTQRWPSDNTSRIVTFQWNEVAQPCSTYLLLDHLLIECVFKMGFSRARMPPGLFTVEFLITITFKFKS